MNASAQVLAPPPRRILTPQEIGPAKIRPPANIRPKSSRQFVAERAARLWYLAQPWLLPVAIFVLWCQASAHAWIAPQILPTPELVWETFLDLLKGGDIASSFQVSVTRLALGFALGAVIGLALGLLIAASRRIEHYINPIFRIIIQVPLTAWMPLFILLLGINETLKIIIIAKGCMIPVALSTAEGIRSIPTKYTEVARVFGLSRRDVILKLTLPAALPQLFSGFRLALSHSWMALVMVELLASNTGLGYMMVWGRTLFQLDLVIVGMIIVGLVGFVMDLGLRHAEIRIRKWAPEDV